uniref:Uncharacterized protein n=1 Tax=Alexandrium monilatum TaxID=311494 RepID=A0A7S4R678_9DINO
MQQPTPWLAAGRRVPLVRHGLQQPLLGGGYPASCSQGPAPSGLLPQQPPLPGGCGVGPAPHSAPPGTRTPNQSASRIVWRSSTPTARPAWAQLKAQAPPDRLEGSTAGSLASSATVLLHQRSETPADEPPRRPTSPMEQSTSLAARLETLERTVAEVSATCKVQAAALERALAEQRVWCESRLESSEQSLAKAQGSCSGQDLEELRSACLQRAEFAEQSATQVRASCVERMEALERTLVQEASARAELRKAVEKEAREQATQEAERVHAVVLREMRERTEGQKALRDEVQFQQQALVRLASRVDEALMEFRTEFPGLSQEHAGQKLEMGRLSNEQASCSARLDALERGLSREPSARRAPEQVADGVSKDDNPPRLVDMPTLSARTVQEWRLVEVAELAREGLAAKEAVQRLEERLRASQEATSRQISQLGARVKESDLGLQRMVDARLAEAEAALRGALLHAAAVGPGAALATERPQRASSTAARRHLSPAAFRMSSEPAGGVRAPMVLFAGPK